MMELITSTSNPRIKTIKKLLSDRKEREISALFVIEGLRLVIEALDKKAAVETLIISPELLKSEVGQEHLNQFREKYPQKILEVSGDIFRSLSHKDGPQGISAVIRQQWSSLEQIGPGNSGVILALDEIADPGNLGTIIRTADAVKVSNIILLDHCTDPYDPSALRGSMGAVFSIPLIKTTFERFLNWQKMSGLPIFGTSDKSSEDYHQTAYPSDLIILMGSERQGLDEKHLEACSKVVSIPMLGSSDSLNLAVATAVMLYEVLNQQRTKPKRSDP